jgi:AraC-like DNA-binding protein
MDHTLVHQLRLEVKCSYGVPMADPSEVRDRLSEVLDLVEARASLSQHLVHARPWHSSTELDAPLELVAVAHGTAHLRTDGIQRPIELEAGDVAILNRRTWLDLRSGAGDAPAAPLYRTLDGGPRQRRHRPALFDHSVAHTLDQVDLVVGVRIDLNQTGQRMLAQALPAVGHVRTSTAMSTSLRCSLDRLLEESDDHSVGSDFAIRQHSQLVVLNVLRAYLAQTDLPPGWLKLVGDQRLRGALALMHTDPGARWTLEELARAALMSRTSFADHFRDVAGVPPLTYLTHWRMLLARRSLRDSEKSVGELGFELGYTSESAFSKAFKREVGQSPLQYRYAPRTGTSGTPASSARRVPAS